MYKNKTFLAVIPARGGSKRLPRKNLLELCGKPLIGWSIEAGLKNKYVDKVVVSSDDDEIINISKKFGADTIKRPSALATDKATTFDTIKHALENTGKYDYLLLLQPTSPLRDAKHIKESIEMLEEKNADAIIGVSEVEHSPLWSNTLEKDNSMHNFIKEKLKNIRSQDLEKYFRVNGAIYLCKIDRLIQEKSFFLSANIYAYKMKNMDSIDIDEEIDFDLANLTMKRKITNET